MRKIIYNCCLLILAATGAAGQTGIGTTSPNSSLDVRGAIALGIRSFTGNTSALVTDEVLVFTGTSATTVTLPDAGTCEGRIYWIKNASTILPVPVLTITTMSSQLIDDAASWALDEPNEVVRLFSDGSNWSTHIQQVPVKKTTTAGGAWNQGGNRLTAVKSIGAITGNDFSFITNNTESMRLTTAGYLGLGTNSPAGRLHSVTDNDDTGNDIYMEDYGATITAGFFIRKLRGTVAAPQNLQSGDLISQFRFQPRYNGSFTVNGGSGIDANYMGNSSNNITDLRLFSSDTERVRINESGRFGINTSVFDVSNPEKLLVDAGNTSSYNVISGKGDIDNYLQLNIQNSSAGASASSDVVATADNGNESASYIDMGINSSGYSNAGLPILNGANLAYLYSTGNDFTIGNGAADQDMIFFTNGYATANERMRITASGNIGIGINNPSDKLTVAGIISPSTDNTYTMGTSTNRWSEVWATNGVIQTSDARLKTNIQSLEYGVKELLQLRPVTYQWKKTNSGQRKIGLIAQEVKKLVPEVVIGDEKKENLGMNYAELVTVLINTIKEQQQQLKSLEKQLASLEKQTK